MRFLVYTLLLLLIPFTGFTQSKQAYVHIDSLNLATDTTKVLERNGNTPPPQVMAATNDLCSGAFALSPATPSHNFALGNSFTGDGVAGDPSQILTGFSSTAAAGWVKYTVPTGTVVGTLSVTLTGANVTGGQVVIFSGGCPPAIYTGTNSAGATPLVIGSGTSGSASSMGAATATASCLVSGQTYYIMVAEISTGTTYSVSTAYSPSAPVGTPTNNCCSDAQDITTSLNSTPISGTTLGATNDAPYIGCNKAYNNVWYSFVAQNANIEVSVSGASNLGPEFQILNASSGTATDVCTSTSTGSVMCSSATSGTATANNVTGTALVPGQTYYISVTTTLTTGGPFTLTVNNPKTDSSTNCSTAALLCSGTTYTANNTNLWGNEELNATTGGCNVANGEIHSAWYVIHVVGAGNMTFTITPTVFTDNFDFSLFYAGSTATPTPSCSFTAAPVSCNTSTLTVNSGKTGLSPAPGGVGNSNTFTSSNQMNLEYPANAGDVFLLMVNSPKVTSPYSVTLGTNGTAPAATYTDCTNFPIILPIELADFTATQNGNEVDLKWSTVTEINNAYFTIEKSADGKTFEKLDKLKSLAENGNSKNLLNYADIDYNPFPGVSYYRLSQTDLNGKNTKISIISVKNKDNDGAFTIAPNPTDGTLYISYNCQTATTGIFKLYDGNGAVVLEQDVVCALGNNKTQIDLTEKISGIYFATFTTNNSFYRVKLMKN